MTYYQAPPQLAARIRAALPRTVERQGAPAEQPVQSGKIIHFPGARREGFTLIGGRLDYLADRAVPAMVYRHNEHIINMFVLPGDGGDATPRRLTVRGYGVLNWTNAGLSYWAVCDLNPSELDRLASLVSTTPEPTTLE
jgi:anti-sigma factor RsiW